MKFNTIYSKAFCVSRSKEIGKHLSTDYHWLDKWEETKDRVKYYNIYQVCIDQLGKQKTNQLIRNSWEETKG